MCPRQGLAELAVLRPKSRYVLMSQFEAVTKRLCTGTTIRGCSRRTGCAAVMSDLLDLVAQFGLGVEPRSGDSGLGCEACHGDGLAVIDHCSEGIAGSLEGLFMALSGNLSEPLGAVSLHRHGPPPGLLMARTRTMSSSLRSRSMR